MNETFPAENVPTYWVVEGAGTGGGPLHVGGHGNGIAPDLRLVPSESPAVSEATPHAGPETVVHPAGTCPPGGQGSVMMPVAIEGRPMNTPTAPAGLPSVAVNVSLPSVI